MEQIIEAKEQHLEDILTMALDLWPEENHTGLKPVFLNLLNSSKNKILLYIVNHQPVSFLYLGIRTDYVEGSDYSPTGFVEGIYVKPEFRKKGISRKLVKQGEIWLKEKGCKQIGSDIYIDNKVSYNFHIGIGFKEAGRLITFIKDL